MCFFNHASFSAKMTLGCLGKLICIALLRRERAAGLQSSELGWLELLIRRHATASCEISSGTGDGDFSAVSPEGFR